MAITQETIVLNEFGLSERRRTTGAGTKARMTVTIKADAIPHVFNAKELGRAPAEAIAATITKQIRGIGEFASLGTRVFREKAKRAFDRGAEWAMNRYSGGRTGPKTPNVTGRLFNDSERLADGIFAGPTSGDEWVVNWPANRLDPATLGEADARKMAERLQSLVPALRGGESLGRDEGVRKAIGDSIYDIIAAVAGENLRLRRAINAQTWAIVRQLAAGVGLL